jgi:hypothetical protein
MFGIYLGRLGCVGSILLSIVLSLLLTMLMRGCSSYGTAF